MKRHSILIFYILVASVLNAKVTKSMNLWYNTPADEWMKSLPVGNGRLGAMIYGGIEQEILSINESSMWAGEYNPEQEQPFGKEKLQELRKLFFEGKLIEGNQIAAKYLSSKNHSFGTHLPIGDVKLNFHHNEVNIKDYKRCLNLNSGIHTVTYKIGDTTFKRECIASNPDDVIIMNITSDKKNSISTDIFLNLLRHPSNIRIEDKQLIFDGQALFKNTKGGVLFEGRVAVLPKGGKMEYDSDTIKVIKANELTLIIDVRTNYKNEKYKDKCSSTVDKVSRIKYNNIKEKHVKDFSQLFNRMEICIGNNDKMNDIPTDERWRLYKKNPSKDAGLIALFFQYGRYLTISSSRENSPLPIALQGFFNDNLACNMCWTSDYHLDINTQQNYWISNIGNLPECNVPLFNYIKDLSVHGHKTAQNVYGCKGWTAHTIANIWGYTYPSPGIGYGLFPTASSWLASHLWTEYEYTLNKNFLKNTAYPLLKGNAEFLLDYMTETPDRKYLVTGPSISPENSYLYNGRFLAASMMPTCDRVLVYEILQSTLKAAKILNQDKELQKTIEEAIKKLPPIRLMANGGIREWMEDYKEAVPNHRHTSHLLSLYPFNQISLRKTPELAKGALTTIENRLSAPGWEDVEWSRANMICFYARLKKPQEAYSSINILIDKFTRENLLSISPKGIAGAPYDIFIFDGNAAGAAGIAEMIIQSQEGYIEFLPCIPQEWDKGSCKGICVKGNAVVDLNWENHSIKEATIYAKSEVNHRIKIPLENTYKIYLNNKQISLNKDTDGCININTKKGDKIVISRNR